MALNFPSAPTDGQEYTVGSRTWAWDAAMSRWDLVPDVVSPTITALPVISDVAPVGPDEGQIWINSTTGKTYLWWVDDDSSQWVEWNTGAASTWSTAEAVPLISGFTETLLNLANAGLWRTALSLYSAAQVDNVIGVLEASVADDFAALPVVVREYLEYRDEKATGVHGGTTTSGSWFTRTLNVESADSGAIGSLAANVITLLAGTYECEITVPAQDCGKHQGRLYNITDAVVLLYGSTEDSGLGKGLTTRSCITGRFTLVGSTNVRIEHRTSNNGDTKSLGEAADFDVAEVYTVARFWKVA